MKIIRKSQAYLTEYFGMSRSEARGFLLVVLFTIICICTPIWIKNYYSDSITLINEQVSFLESNDESGGGVSKHVLMPANLKTNVVKCDPNVLTIEEWEGLGVSSVIAKRIVKYTDKGGRFRKKEDILKIYGFPPNIYELISARFVFETTQKKLPQTGREQKVFAWKQAVLDINHADSAQFVSLPGIGPAFARRIVLYRSSLGGFYDKKQISEIYGLDSTTYLKLLPYLSISKDFKTNKLSLSKSENKSWFKHPYFRKIAKEIIQFKKVNPASGKVEFLQHFAPNELERIKLATYLED